MQTDAVTKAEKRGGPKLTTAQEKQAESRQAYEAGETIL